MLVLTRKKGEKITLGDDIEIEVIHLDNGKVKLGIKAPKNLKILRTEVLQQVKEENKEALTINIDILNNFIKK
ncbi:carbon storage regulator CsrA [Clostridium grantii]|uniref:Translational regulator CsrA n=1 Tax=Clostridium grantii DSM 8605 TaxID=1121316 RepID=A0A1M5W7C1_9CLOT|nr:carbon storage regulator CsrA [Clostridium grantii]SHH83422.1 carbon storage regulator, CsrA [Clostridium grantii DSM 8605]